MGRVTTEAIVLRRTPFGETSQIAEFLTRERGRLSLILKGVHRPKSRKGGGVDLLDHCRVTYTQRKGSRSLPQLVERRVLTHHPRMRRRIDLMVAGQYVVELLRSVVPEGQRVAPVHDLSVACLAALEDAPPPASVGPIVFAFEGGVLRQGGFEPVLDRCVVCDRRPEGFRVLRCDPVRGGIVCSACRTGADHSFSLSSDAARALRAMARQDPRLMADVALPEALQVQMRRFYDRVLVHVLERPPRCQLVAERLAS